MDNEFCYYLVYGMYDVSNIHDVKQVGLLKVTKILKNNLLNCQSWSLVRKIKKETKVTLL